MREMLRMAGLETGVVRIGRDERENGGSWRG